MGALVLAGVAQAASLDTGLIVLAAGLVLGTVATWRLSLPRPGAIAVTPAEAMPLPDLEPTAGAVLVVVSYPVAPGSEAGFLAKSGPLRRLRRRTGAIEWRLFSDPAAAGGYVETYLVGSWEEHERQHARVTTHDKAVLEEIDALLAPGGSRQARHYFAVTSDGAPRARGRGWASRRRTG